MASGLCDLLNRSSGILCREQCSVHAAQVLAGLNELRQSGRFCDVTLQAGTKKILAHRIVLSSGSKYFDAMFSHPVLESISRCVTINDVAEDDLVQLINFLYTGEIEIDDKTVETLLAASNLLQIPFVSDACCRFLQSQLHPENCLGIFRFANLHNCTELSEVSFRFAEEHFPEVSKGLGEFLELDVDGLERLVSSDHLPVSENIVFDAIRRWIEHDLKNRQKYAERLFEHVRFGLLSRDYLVQFVKSSDCLLATPWCQKRLSQAIIYHLSPFDDDALKDLDQFKPRMGISQMLMVIAGWAYSDIPSVECFDFHTGLWKVESTDPNANQSPSSMHPVIPDIPRSHAYGGVAVLHNKVYVIGGCYANQYAIRYVDIYDTTRRSWTQGPNLQCARDDLGVAVLNGLIYAIGGYDENEALSNAEVLDVSSSGAWSFIASMSCPRRRFGVAALGGRIYAVGGQGEHEVLSSAEYYDPLVLAWTSIADTSFPRFFHAVCALDERIYIIGGLSETRGCLSAVEYYSPATDSWQSAAQLNVARSSAGAVAHRDLLYVVGGKTEGNYLKSIEMYSPHTDTWTCSPEEMQTGRSAPGVAVVRLPL